MQTLISSPNCSHTVCKIISGPGCHFLVFHIHFWCWCQKSHFPGFPVCQQILHTRFTCPSHRDLLVRAALLVKQQQHSCPVPSWRAGIMPLGSPWGSLSTIDCLAAFFCDPAWPSDVEYNSLTLWNIKNPNVLDVEGTLYVFFDGFFSLWVSWFSQLE